MLVWRRAKINRFSVLTAGYDQAVPCCILCFFVFTHTTVGVRILLVFGQPIESFETV